MHTKTIEVKQYINSSDYYYNYVSFSMELQIQWDASIVCFGVD